MVRDLFTREIWGPAAANVPAENPALAVNLVAAQVLGLVMARYVIRAEAVASLPAEAVIGLMAPNLQRLLGNGVAVREKESRLDPRPKKQSRGGSR